MTMMIIIRFGRRSSGSSE